MRTSAPSPTSNPSSAAKTSSSSNNGGPRGAAKAVVPTPGQDAADARAFSSNDATKDARFEFFFARCGDQLARYGLSQRQVRDSIRAAIVFDQLPPEVAYAFSCRKCSP